MASASSTASLTPALTRGAGAGMLLLLGFGALVVLVQRYDAPAVLLAGVVLLAAMTLLLRPELATLLTVFLLYTNIPAILPKRYGVPVAAAGAFILLLGIPLLQALIGRRERLRVDATFYLMLAYLAVVLLSSLVAKDPWLSLEYAQRFLVEAVLLYLLVVNVVRSRATLRRVTWTVLAAGALLGALTTYQEITGSYGQEFGGLAERNYEYAELRQLDRDDPEIRELIRAYNETYGPTGRSQRANGPMDEPNRFAQILVVLLPLALLCYRVGRSAWARAAAVVAGMLILGGVMFTDSRGAFITLLLLLLLTGYMRWVPRSYLLAGTVATVLLASMVAPRFVERVASIAGMATLVERGAASDPAVDGAIKGRAMAMLAAVHVFMDHPLLGVGAEQFKPFYSVPYQEKDPRHAFRESVDFYAHSLYLELAAELGMLGLIAFLAIFVELLRKLDRARRRWRYREPEMADYATAFFLSIIGYLGTSVFLHSGYYRYLWLLTALGSASLHILRPTQSVVDGGVDVAR